MRRALAALLLAMPLALSAAPAWAQAESREGIYLQNQILQLRQELDQLRRSGGSSVPAPTAPRGAAPSSEMVGVLLDRVTALQEETRRLRGRLDEVEYRNRTLQQTVEKMQGDIDYRLQQVENQPAARPAAPASRTPAPAPSPAPAPAPSPTPAPAAARTPERALSEGQ